MVLITAIRLIATIFHQTNLRLFLDNCFPDNYRFHYTRLSSGVFFFTPQDNSACELISSIEVKDIIILHLHSAKKHAFK